MDILNNLTREQLEQSNAAELLRCILEIEEEMRTLHDRIDNLRELRCKIVEFIMRAS